MDPITLAALIGGGTSLLGGIFGQNNQANINAQNIANQQYLASNRIQLTVADANKAGINPLAALGNATQTYSNIVGSNALGEGISSAGQNLSRAIAAKDPAAARQQELDAKLTEAKIANVNSDTVKNTAAASEVVKSIGAPGTPPAIPMPRPDMRRVGREFYAEPLMQDFVGPHGGVVTLPSAAASTASQNWMSMPGQIAGAAGIIGENLDNWRADTARTGQQIIGAAGRAATDYAPYWAQGAGY